MTRLPFLLFLLLINVSCARTPSPITLRVTIPATIRIGAPFTATFEVKNTSGQSLYFKQPWKWSTDGLFLVAVARNGTTIESDTRLYDIAREHVCKYIRRLPPGGTIRFKANLNEQGPFSPSLQLTEAGEYQLWWVYEVAQHQDESSCIPSGWHLFTGRTQSEPVRFRVTP